MTSTPILHCYDASPFTQKALKALALAKLAYRSVETPMIAPKPDLERLTGGYRGTPVMQSGADVFVDNFSIFRQVARQQGDDGRMPRADDLALAAASFWGDAFFEGGLLIAIKEYAHAWEDDFQADREQVFSRLDFDEASRRFDAACSQLRYYAAMVDARLQDGRAFIDGDEPGLHDLHAWPVFWFSRAIAPMPSLYEPFAHLDAWEARVRDVGEGQRTPVSAQDAFAVAAASEPAALAAPMAGDPLAGLLGMHVSVSPDTSNRGVSTGRLVALTPGESVIALDDAELGAIHVHFPRVAYSVAPAEG